MTQVATPAMSEVELAPGTVRLGGALGRPAGARGLVLFAHGSGSGRTSPRNRSVAETLQRAGFATLLFDLLSAGEEDQVAAMAAGWFRAHIAGRRA